MTPSETSLLGAIAHGKTPQIDRSDLNPEWIQTDYVREITAGAIDLHRTGRVVNLLNLIAVCRNVPRTAWPLVTPIFSNGYGEVDPGAAVAAVKSDYMLRIAGSVAEEIRQLSQTQPGKVRTWLPSVTGRLVSTIRSSYDYDARPSAHASKPMPEPLFTSRIEKVNEMLRDCYRSRAFILYAGLTKHGKTTTLISHAIDGLYQDKKVSYVITEGTEQEALARIVCGLADLSWEHDVRYKTWQTPGSKEKYDKWEKKVEDLLRIYNWEWLNDERLMRIATWDKPDLILIDYLKNQPGMFADERANRHFDPVGDIADFIRNRLCATGVAVISAGQMSADAAKRVLKQEAETPEPLYGSARPGYASHEYIMLKRGYSGTAHYRVWLDGIGNRQNTIHDIEFNAKTWTLQFPWQERAINSQGE